LIRRLWWSTNYFYQRITRFLLSTNYTN